MVLRDLKRLIESDGSAASNTTSYKSAYQIAVPNPSPIHDTNVSGDVTRACVHVYATNAACMVHAERASVSFVGSVDNSHGARFYMGY